MIEGKLVNLRAYEPTDAAAWTRWYNDSEAIEHLSWRYPFSLEAEEAFLQDRTSTLPGYANVLFAIETKEGEHIGGINFNQTYVESRKARLGITIGDKAYWSKGYGSDALVTLLRFGFAEMNLHRIELDVYAFNERARASYRKCRPRQDVSGSPRR